MVHEIEIREALSAEEIEACWPVLFNLRPHLVHEEFVSRVQQQQKEDGYRLFYIQSKNSNNVEAIIGFRFLNFLYSGKTIYIDDLCTLPGGQRNGYGGQLLKWADKLGHEANCVTMSLDSGYTRNKAHRLYLNHGFDMTCHHFAKKLT